MGNLFYPQLASGAISQYPIRKANLVRTIKNVLLDGSMLFYSDPNGRHSIWQLVYTELDEGDMQDLRSHFLACSGPFRAFTFIDPTENMLVWSSDLRRPPWVSLGSLHLQPGLADPDRGNAGFTVTNAGQVDLDIKQTLTVPAGYQYCFSAFASSPQETHVVLTRGGLWEQKSTTLPIGPEWKRLVSSGRLADNSTQFTVAISVPAGQQVRLYGIQLEPQVVPSRYRPTASVGGVHANAHWGVDQLTINAEAPNLYSTSFTIETVIKS